MASSTVRLTVSSQVAEIINKKAPKELQMAAARGAVPLAPGDLLTTLLFLSQMGDPDLRRQAFSTLRTLPVSVVQSVAADPAVPAQLLHLIAKIRLTDVEVVQALASNPATADATLIALARDGSPEVLQPLALNDQRLASCPELREALLANPRCAGALLDRLRSLAGSADAEPPAPAEVSPDQPTEGVQENGCAEDEEDTPEEEALNQSKYQLSLEMPVAEKIKTALTGDKEWRTIFLRDANKLVSGAVLKNPRITEGEVLAVARNRSANDELIRLILLNNEWLKNSEIRKALVVHPRTPLPKALRFMSVFSEKELKNLAKSRNVSQVIVNNARRMLMAKDKKKS